MTERRQKAVLNAGVGAFVVDEDEDWGHADCTICEVARALRARNTELPHGARLVEQQPTDELSR